jgi:hypothetical protein
MRLRRLRQRRRSGHSDHESERAALSPAQRCAPGNHWIKVRLHGTKSNRSAIGAKVTIRSGSKVQVQEVMSQSSYVSANDPRLHFGLGAADSVELEVRWPLGSIEVHKTYLPIGLSPAGRFFILKAEKLTPAIQPVAGHKT